jgi:hypothetical protein
MQPVRGCARLGNQRRRARRERIKRMVKRSPWASRSPRTGHGCGGDGVAAGGDAEIHSMVIDPHSPAATFADRVDALVWP